MPPPHPTRSRSQAHPANESGAARTPCAAREGFAVNRTVRAYVGLGANLAEARAHVEAALLALDDLPGTRLVARSSLYFSAPIDAQGPDFVNAVAALDTELGSGPLLDALQAIEIAHGRERTGRNAPRTLDLDLLLYGDAVADTPRLTLPHPRLHERAFVLIPLLEIAPAVEIPGHGPACDLLPAVAHQAVRPA